MHDGYPWPMDAGWDPFCPPGTLIGEGFLILPRAECEVPRADFGELFARKLRDGGDVFIHAVIKLATDVRPRPLEAFAVPDVHPVLARMLFDDVFRCALRGRPIGHDVTLAAL